MCLSTVYDGYRSPDRVLLKNVQRLHFDSGRLVCTDLMERESTFEGTLSEADLVEGWIVIKTKESEK